MSLQHISTGDSHANQVLIEALNFPISMDYHYGYV